MQTNPRNLKLLCLAASGVALAACGSTGLDEEPVGSATDAIWNGNDDVDPNPASLNAKIRNDVVLLTVVRPDVNPMLPNKTGVCTASFITEDVVLTASHCVLAKAGETGALISGDVSIGPMPTHVRTRRRNLVGYIGRWSAPYTLDMNRAHDIALVFLEPGAAALAREPLGPDGTAGTLDDPLGPDGVNGTPDDLDEYYPVSARPYRGTPISASGTFSSVELRGYGRDETDVPAPIATRQVNFFNQLAYSRSFYAPNTGPDLNGDGAPDPYPVGAIRVFWSGSLGPAGIWGDGDDVVPVFPGVGHGDSGGPLMRLDAAANRFVQIGVASTSCTPAEITDPNPMVAGDEYYTCAPFKCPAGQTWGMTATGTLGCIGSANPPVQGIWGSAWADLSTTNQWLNTCTTNAQCPAESACLSGRCFIQGNQEWLDTYMKDPTRPGAWIGERDYRDACRTDVDANCDRTYDAVNNCPALFDSGASAGYNPANFNTLSKLAVYGKDAVYAFDRVKLLANDGTPAGMATAGGSDVRNDTNIGQLITGGSVALFGHRYSIGSFLTTPTTTIQTQDGRSLVTTFTAKVPNLIVNASFPTTKYADIVLEPGQAYPTDQNSYVLPNSYIGSATIRDRAVLRLGPGKYYFDRLVIDAGGRLEVNHASGQTEIYIRAASGTPGLTYAPGAGIRSRNGDPHATLVVVLADNHVPVVNVDETFNGTLVVPKGFIWLGSKPHFGAFYAGSGVGVMPDAVVRHRPLVCGATTTARITSSFTTTSSTGTRFCGDLIVRNESIYPTRDWQVGLHLNGTAVTSWQNGNLSSTTGAPVVTPLAANRIIPAGGAISNFNLCVSRPLGSGRLPLVSFATAEF